MALKNSSKKSINLTDRLQPQNIEAEQSVLGALLIDQDAITKIADMVRAEDFYTPAHQKIFAACLAIYEKHDPIDTLSLSTYLEEKKQLEKIGGRSYIAKLTNSVPSASNIKNYAGMVQKKSTLRRLIAAAHDITSLGYQEDGALETLLDQAEQQIFQVSQNYLKQNFVPIQDLLSSAFERIDELHKDAGKLRGLPTGFTQLDDLLAGLQKSDLVVLAARPSMGKTSLALDIARHVAVNNKTPIGIFSLEMSKEQLADRMLCAEANVGLWKMRTGRLSDKDEYGSESDFSKLGNAFGKLSESNIHIDDSALLNVMEIRTKARRLAAEHGLGLIIIDYLQLIDSPDNIESRVQEVAKITRSLKALARELDLPVLALSQLSRAVEARSPSLPKLSDLRESGTIEQDADVVMFIYRKVMDRSIKTVEEDEKHIAQLNIAKHRNGPVGNVDLYFDEEPVSFKNLAGKAMTKNKDSGNINFDE
jgi:replicative DNA helicase